jgi:MoaA/NifB/PqqE/SkfB family radical SAM enzyme
MNARQTRSPLRAPFTVCMWITDYCNLACKYCYAMPFSGRRISTDRALELFDEMADMGVFNFTLAGGEPFLHPDILKIILHGTRRGIRVGVLSNGIAIDQEAIAVLEKHTNPKNFMLQISLDSVDPATNNLVRGKTDKVLENIERIAGTSIDLQMACVIHKLNVSSAHRMIDAFYPRVKRFHFLNIQRTKQALKHPELLLDEEDTEYFWPHLGEYAKRFPPDLLLPSLRVQLRSKGQALGHAEFSMSETASFDCTSCSAGLTHLQIDSKLNVLGCDIAKDYTMMGNVAEQSFSEVYHSAQAHQVRNAPYPACYRISNDDGRSLADNLR